MMLFVAFMLAVDVMAGRTDDAAAFVAAGMVMDVAAIRLRAGFSDPALVWRMLANGSVRVMRRHTKNR